jgi:hypothetical protein
MYTGTDSRTPAGLGQITLVAPTKVRHQFGEPRPGGGLGTFVLLGTLTLNFVPEPGTLLLLGAGGIGLGFVGRRRRLSSRSVPSYSRSTGRSPREGEPMGLVVRVLAAVAATLLATGGPAGAAPFGATLGLSASALGGAPTLFVTGAGSGTSAPLLVTIPGGVLAGSDSTAVTGNPLAQTIDLKVTGNGPGSFTGSLLKGALPLRGNFRVLQTMATVTTILDVPLSIPVTYGYLGFGVGGTVTLAQPGGFNASFLVEHRPFGVGPTVVSGLPYTYTYHVPIGKHASHVSTAVYTNGTAAYTGTDSRTPGGIGQVTLVSPTKVQHIVAGSPGGLGTFVVLGTLTLNFVPEPGTLVLLGLGAAGLGLVGRARARRS